MKKYSCLLLSLLLAFFGGCTARPAISETYFYFDTAVTLTAVCDRDVLEGGFALCARYEALFSRTKENSDVWRINHDNGPVEVDAETAALVQRALVYAALTDGRLDITIAPIAALYDFNNGVVPAPEQVEPLLACVDWRRVRVAGNTVDAGGCQIDLGAIAKGYVADRLHAYFAENGVSEAVVNLGGNLWLTGNRNRKASIKRPFANETCLLIEGGDMTLATSGIDQRFVEQDGVLFSHILDPDTGYGVQNELAQVTVIGTDSTAADALSTACMLLGGEQGAALIESLPGTEAVFVDRQGNLRCTSGLDRLDEGAVRFAGQTKVVEMT